MSALFPYDLEREITRDIGLKIFPLNELPERLPIQCSPIIDKTFGFILFVNGGHELITEKLGCLHRPLEQERVIGDEAVVEHFLRFHGYYWTGALSRSPKLVTTKDFKFDSTDKQIALRYRLSMMDPDYPFG